MYREVILKVRRTIFSHDVTVHAISAPSSFLTWLKSVFRDGRRLAHLLDRAVRLLRHGARRAGERAPCLEIIQRQLRTPRPAEQAAEVKMVGYITISSRHSPAAQREVAPLCLYICCHHFFVHLLVVLAWSSEEENHGVSWLLAAKGGFPRQQYSSDVRDPANISVPIRHWTHKKKRQPASHSAHSQPSSARARERRRWRSPPPPRVAQRRWASRRSCSTMRLGPRCT